MLITKTVALIITAASALNLVAGTAQASSDAGAKIPVYNDGSYIYNNMWGSDGAGRQTIRKRQERALFEWNWPGTTKNVKGYPSIVRGWHWDTPKLHNGLLPIHVSSPSSCALRSKVGYEVKAVGSYDVAYDLWASTSPNLSWQTHPTLEVMIWGEHEGTTPAGSPVGKARIAGRVWSVWKGDGAFGGPVVSFVSDNSALRGQLDLMQFMRLAAGQGADPALRLVGTEFGIEVDNGSGSATVHHWVEQRSSTCV
ncbi:MULTISPECIES: GH12 family glycosyl hydrolase domain-containing protein [Curtobacterium]|jgi:hypothetical protein|uniref:Uncharacterized protein n=3 Tax=Curtobacterium TaxID=2034 RepID=A0A6G7GBG4_9MICO|nr:hypothetical protein [Curtobacterium flaccumfaciens]MBT1543013.1 hypothetical protein [Curtobacterium flaccumfaciens pv. flaccumfaciens]MBT1545785.1 hypothetical protein [Curtobacterium flaccumfaciens pv. flaccumfaciens]MBT1585718.1 hypothetical protein [Curtobacterium flaccumfaciens pv. flaccumfaciens]MBT1588987.1 hypothetical protein [Curtobacterium flaccumfaciens pv. flaccumfaciens]MBT1667069.1 hypothetical protein [Curtobacterium flaccumfaciens pv. flaccumfaciens]